MSKNTKSNLTLGDILAEIRAEGEAKGQEWIVPRLYITRNEASPANVTIMLEKLHKTDRGATLEDARRKFLFPFYKNREGHWRHYTREEADDLKERIKEVRRYV